MNPDLDKQPSRNRWPYPGDNPLVRARKVAQMYRARLRALNEEACDQADAAAQQFGETWVVPKVVTAHDDDLLDPADAADFLCTSTANIRRLRLAGRLNGHDTDSGWKYKGADLRNLQHARPRGGVAKIDAKGLRSAR